MRYSCFRNVFIWSNCFVYLDAPFILNSIKKLAVTENHDITTECVVDAYPKADITWFGPSGQRLSSFAEEKVITATVISSELHCKFILFCLIY
jgi:hypothetical protein